MNQFMPFNLGPLPKSSPTNITIKPSPPNPCRPPPPYPVKHLKEFQLPLPFQNLPQFEVKLLPLKFFK